MAFTSLFTRRAHFSAGSIIFNKGENRDLAYIIESGTVEILHGIENPITILAAGEIFGEMALLDAGSRTATARAASDVSLFVVPPALLQERMRGLDPIISLLFSLLIERYRSNRLEHHETGDAGVAFIKKHEEDAEDPPIMPAYVRQKRMALEELRMEQDIRRALDNREFKPYLQPIVLLPEGRIIGFETLIRWHHPERGIVPPNDFIPVAERTNVIKMIDKQVFEAACEVLPRLHAAIGEHAQKPFISINLSGINFDNDEVVHMVRSILEASSVDPAHIKLEITESALIGNPQHASDLLESLKQLGVSIALDDFGVGYSSLGYLSSFPIDGIKIDRSFVHKIRDDERSRNIVQAIVGLAQSFNLGVVAEGIETPDDAALVHELGCDQGQGYLFGRPLSIEDAIELLKKVA